MSNPVPNPFSILEVADRLHREAQLIKFRRDMETIIDDLDEVLSTYGIVTENTKEKDRRW